MRRSSAAGLAAAALAACAPARADTAPWRVRDALRAPSWLSLGVEHRARVERVDPDVRAPPRGAVTAPSLRTLLRLEARTTRAIAGLELIDARAIATRDGARSASVVDPLDVLQAYAGPRGNGVLVDDDQASLAVGRFTIDLGSRRLVTRNGFRNTISSFTGVDARGSVREHSLRALAVAQVVRVPATSDALARGELARDRENAGAVLWAVLFASRGLAARVLLESYVLGLHERDTADVPSANRRLVTPGLRVVRAPASGVVDWHVEGMAQLGTSRATPAAGDRQDLRHRAAAGHVELGRRLSAPWRPRAAALLDVATGDRDPSDGVQGRFDPLCGARTLDFGPTGRWGALARRNLASPGARDRAGASGAFVGHHVDARARWAAWPGNLAIEGGGALLLRGRFAREAPGGPPSDPGYLYRQLTGTI